MLSRFLGAVACSLPILIWHGESAYADWVNSMARGAARGIDRSITRQAQESATQPAQTHKEPTSSERRSFGDYLCTDDCSGHRAGYEWAQRNGTFSYKGCVSDSRSFTEGCISYIDNPPDNVVERVRADVLRTTRKIIYIFREHGVIGTIIATQDCYKMDRYKIECLYMDVASRRFDYIGTQLFGTDYNKYHSKIKFSARFNEWRKHENISAPDAKLYIKMIHTMIVKIIEVEQGK